MYFFILATLPVSTLNLPEDVSKLVPSVFCHLHMKTFLRDDVLFTDMQCRKETSLGSTLREATHQDLMTWSLVNFR